VLAVVIVVAAILVAATAVALVHALAGPGGSHNRAGLDAAARAAAGRSGAADASITPRPTPAASSPRPTPAGSHALASPAAAPNPAPAAASQQCKSPQFVTSSPTGGWADGSYYLYNDMWNAAKYSVQQTLYACSSSSWYVVATMNNDSGDGAVKTYPNVHEDFSEPAIASFRSISSTFAEASPHVGIYEDAYDIWLNGVASSGSTEVMIWTENHGQAPSGSDLATVSFGGRSYQVWRSGSYVAFVAATNFTAGTVDLLAIFRWLINAGWIPASSTLGQIDYGAELVSTNGAPATFSFMNFSVTTS
jgi:hypothetical protein